MSGGFGPFGGGADGPGDVDGPVSSTDEAIVRYDGTNGKVLQNSTVTITDAGAVAGVTTLNGKTADSLVEGAASSTDNAIARFDGTTGELIQNSSGVTITDGNGLVVVASAATTAGVTSTGNTSGAGGVFTGGNAGNGVNGTAGSTNNHGVQGTGLGASTSIGVYGLAGNGGIGVQAQSSGSAGGYALVILGDTTSPVRAALQFVPQDNQPTGASLVGDMYVTTAGVLKICTAAGTPGTWVSVGAQT